MPGPTAKSLRVSFPAVALVVVTAAMVVLALLNARQLRVYRQPTDNILWQPTTDGLQAQAVAPGRHSPVRPGDFLVAINGVPVRSPEAVAHRLFQAGVGKRLDYVVRRGLRLLPLTVAVKATHPALGRYLFLEIVGLLYLGMGLFVLYRRQRAPQARLFYLFCLSSFVLYCFHYTGKLNLFDRTVFWSNEAALLLTPCLLVHFALGFRTGGGRRGSHPGWTALVAGLVYAPALMLGLAEVAFATQAISLPLSLSVTQGVLDRASYMLLAVYFVAAVALFARKGDTRAAALQARVMSWGTAIAVAPFLALYVLPFVWGVELPPYASLSVLSLALIPVAFSYAIWRHRLLEAEVVFRRGVVYTLATAAVVAVYLGIISLAGMLIHSRVPAWGWTGWLLAILTTALLFEPLKRWLQERIDRLFYRERYDYRRTLIEFGRQMNAQPDLDPLLSLVIARLVQTLSLERAAVFLVGDDGFALARGFGLHPMATAAGLDLGFLDQRFLTPGAAPERWFLEFPAGAARVLDLHYYLPCSLQGRTVAVLGLGKAAPSAFLSTEDLELVETLAGYFAIALENARLYATLRRKADEYQRLKDFNENIVESIQVGVIAVNLEGVVEGWNAQMESLAGVPRQQALGRPLAGLLGEEFAREFAQAGPGVRTVPKFRLRAGEREKVVNLAIAPLVTARFERVGQIVLFSDVTAEAEMEQQLIQADRLRSVGLLAAGVAHEVNTPLAVISSYAQMLAKQTAGDDPRARMLDTITRQTFRASEIVANLLNFSRTGGSRFGQVELNTVVRDTLALVEHPLKSANIHVIAALHPHQLSVRGDAGKLQQVFLNLILNARDAMPRGGTLQLSTGGGPGQAWVAVSDSGEGIPAELHHRIFDPFFTTKSARRTTPAGASGGTMSTGTGLGLAVTYGIVQEHGGAIRVHSEIGRGAEFRVELPLWSPAPQPAEAVYA